MKARLIPPVDLLVYTFLIMLTQQERALLFRYCWDHPVASCSQCKAEYRVQELGADLFQGFSHLCPTCRADLTQSAREHLLSCTVLQAQRAESEAAKELQHRSTELQEDNQQARDRAESL